MADDPKPVGVQGPRPVRYLPAAILVAVYWIFQLFIAETDMAMFSRFMSGFVGNLAFLLLFLIFWLANTPLTWRTRLAGLGLLIGGAALGSLLTHSSIQTFGFLISSLPIVLTGWTGVLILSRLRARPFPTPLLAAVMVAGFGYFDLVRWEGLDGHLKSTFSWRWSPSKEPAVFTAAAVASSAKPWTPKPGDWPEFRGALRDGVVKGVKIDPNWKEHPPTVLWKGSVGPGWSSVIVIDGFLVTQEQHGEKEAIVCYEAETGKPVWCHEDAGRFSEGMAGPGPRATPTYRDGRIYSLGGNGLLLCLEAASGKTVWSRALLKETDPVPQWGFSASPLVVDGKVIVFAGGAGAQGALAFDAATGVPAWSRLAGKESYSSAQLITIQGKPQILMHDNKNLVGLSAADGTVLWERPGEDEKVIPMLQYQPIGEGRLLITSGTGVAMIEVKEAGGKWTVEEKWSTKRFRPSFSDFVVHEGHVYGFDDGVLSCVELKTGERVWRKGRYGSGQLLLLADQSALVLLSERGEIALVPAKPTEPEEPLRIAAIEGKTWNHPVIAQDRLIVRNAKEMACYRLRMQ